MQTTQKAEGRGAAWPTAEGFGLIETLIGASIIGAVLLGLAAVGQHALRLVNESASRLQAAYLAEEGIEAARLARDAGWAAYIAPLLLNTDYGLAFANGWWRLEASSTPLVDGAFLRSVRFSEVRRDAADRIVESGGAVDPNARSVAVSVSWSNRGRIATTTIQTYLTNLFNN